MSHYLQKHLSAKSKKQKHLIDPIMGIAAVAHPLMATPQVYTIYTTHSSTGVSLWTWLGFMIIGSIFLTYSIVHCIRPLIVTQILWFVVDFLVVAGILLYN